MTNTRKITLTVGITLRGVLGGSLVAYLVYPGTPSRSKFMAFDGDLDDFGNMKLDKM